MTDQEFLPFNPQPKVSEAEMVILNALRQILSNQQALLIASKCGNGFAAANQSAEVITQINDFIEGKV